jgi:hypothetical protein
MARVEAIKQTLDVLLKDLKARKEKVAEISPEALAQKIFSRKESDHARAGYLKNGVLYLRVDSSTWLYYFNLHKKELLGKFSGQNNQIRDLKFSLGEVAPKKRA